MVRESVPPKPIEFAAQPRQVRIDIARTALLIVDMQNDFCSPGGYVDHLGGDCEPARALFEPINALTAELRRVGAHIVWVNWGNRADRRNLSASTLHAFHNLGSGLGIGDPLPSSDGSRILTRDSWSAAIADELDHRPDDIYVDKYRISGFWDTQLDSILRQAGVTTLLFAGVNTDQCVMCTLQDANFLGYDTILVEDCTATSSPSFCYEATLYNVRACFGFTVTSLAITEAVQALAT
ncbi:MAG: cysteine hydrolase [Proteobacteria bacterium]|nr:cysteine hydrolase [Pseudomonadota bacterium]